MRKLLHKNIRLAVIAGLICIGTITATGAIRANALIKPDTAKVANPNAIPNEAAFFALLNLDLPQLAAVKEAVAQKNWGLAKKQWGLYLQNRQGPNWLWSRKNKPEIKKLFTQYFGLDFYSQTADGFLERKFTFENVAKQLPHDFNWRVGSAIWEQLLSRHNWFPTLGYAYLLTGKKAYAADFNMLVLSWVQQHPVLPDVTKSWNTRDKAWMTLEVGLRMGNWIGAMEAFLDAPEFTAEGRYQMTRSMVEQMRYLDGWVVNYRVGNWQMTEATGMAFVGIMFPEFKDADAWRAKAFKFLAAHMDRDVYADGTHVEVTPGYHSGVAEQCLSVALILKANGYSIPGLLDKHQKMYDFILGICKPDKKYPPLGDVFSGDASRTLGLGAAFYNRPDMKWLGPQKPNPDWVWLIGADKINQYVKMKPQIPTLGSVQFPDSKYNVLRSGWAKDDLYVMLDAAPSLGSHSHGDRLQVVAYSGRDLLIDPGQLSYSEPQSEYFRTTKPHNVVVIDGKEQEKINPTVTSWNAGTALDYTSAKLPGTWVVHQRTLILVKSNYAIVVDRLESDSVHTYSRLFQFPVASNASVDDLTASTHFADGVNILVYPTELTAAEIKQMPVPINATTTNDAPQVSFTNQGRSLTLATVLFPFTAKDQIPQIKRTKTGADRIELTLTFADGHQDIIAVAQSSIDLKINSFEKHAPVLLVRKDKDGHGRIIE